MQNDGATNVIPIQEELPTLIRMLRKPAGEDPRFASFAEIKTNRSAFVEQVHSTWKYLHRRSLDEILAIEKVLSSERRKRLPQGVVWYLERAIGIWRRINDAIVWCLVGQKDHIIRTVCHRKVRPRLTDSNPNALRRLIDSLNEDPLTVAIWSDATSCVDVGDIVCLSWSGKPSGFFEAKEGVINDRIIGLLGVKGTPEELVEEIAAFADGYGPKALKQLERVVKQGQRYNQFMDIIDHDQGFDPRRGAHVTIQESAIRLESYDKELQLTIDASVDGPALRCIDRCLWVYADRDRSKHPEEKIGDFARALAERSPGTWQWFREHFGEDAPFEPVVLEGNLTCPEAIPLFLGRLEPDTVRDLLIGKLMFCVFLLVDWCEYGRIIGDLGAELAWSSAKAGRSQGSKPRPQRLLTVADRIPRVQLADGNYIEGFSKIYRVLFEGITPTSIAAQYVDILRSAHTPPSR